MDNVMNYDNAFNALKNKENRNWFNPKKTGRYAIVFLSELGEPYKVKFKNEEVEKTSCKIKIGENEFDYSITIGKTEGSLYGQLIYLAYHWKGLKGKSINLLVKDTIGKDNQAKREFTVDEYIDLKSKESK